MNIWSFEYLWAFAALVPILYCLYRCKRTPQKRYFPHLQFFGNPGKWRNLDWLFKVAAAVLIVSALASPVMTDFSDPRNRNGIDIVLSLDGSGSMNASGFAEGESRATRFEVVQKIASDFVMKRREDNVGVVLFGDFAFIATPVTYEKEIIAEMIGYLSFGMAGQNTAIGEGVAQGVRALKDSKAKSKVIILLTDGEHNSGAISPKEAVEMARKEGIKLYTIGIGEKGEFDSKLLAQMAKDGGGEYFSAMNEKELADVYAQIDSMERSRIKSAEHTFAEPYYQWPLAGALVLILWMMSRRRVRG